MHIPYFMRFFPWVRQLKGLRLAAMASINRTFKTFNPAASEPKSFDRLAKTLIGTWNDVRHRYFKATSSPNRVYLCILC